MDHLAPPNVPLYETRAEGRAIWERCAERGHPVLAIRDAQRGFVVHYDLVHLDSELSPAAVQALRERVRSLRSYPTGTDPISEAEGVGGEAGPLSGALHADSETDARRIASHVSAFLLDRDNWA